MPVKSLRLSYTVLYSQSLGGRSSGGSIHLEIAGTVFSSDGYPKKKEVRKKAVGHPKKNETREKIDDTSTFAFVSFFSAANRCENRSTAEAYRGTSLIRNSPLLGPYSRTVFRALWWPQGGGVFLMSEVPLDQRADARSTGWRVLGARAF